MGSGIGHRPSPIPLPPKHILPSLFSCLPQYHRYKPFTNHKIPLPPSLSPPAHLSTFFLHQFLVRHHWPESMLNFQHGSRCHKLQFAETELRLGIGFPCEPEIPANATYGKRGYAETVDLKLNLSSQDVNNFNFGEEMIHHKINHLPCANYPVKSPAKVQAVGWPPVRSFRKNAMTVHHQRSNTDEKDGTTATAAFVKVSLEGAPYLRKVDLKMYKTYQELSEALAKMFGSFTTTGNCDSDSQGRLVDFMNESKVIDLVNGSEYVPTYEDRDGDWMLVGDVPWEMFVGSCKRLRIMKGTDAKGLAPTAMEKCKSTS